MSDNFVGQNSGMIAALMATKALAGTAQAKQRMGTQQGFVSQASDMFGQIGTEESAAFAKNLTENPRAAYATAEAFGGFEKMFMQMKSQAAQRNAATSMASISQEAGNTPLTQQQILGELGPELMKHGVPNAVGIIQSLLTNAASGGNVMPKWWKDNVRPADWTPDSYKASLLYGMETNDWERGSLNRLKPRPIKDPNALTPSNMDDYVINQVVLKDTKSRQDHARGVPHDQIQFVTEAEEMAVNNFRKTADQANWDRYKRFNPPKPSRDKSFRMQGVEIPGENPAEESTQDHNSWLESLEEAGAWLTR